MSESVETWVRLCPIGQRTFDLTMVFEHRVPAVGELITEGNMTYEVTTVDWTPARDMPGPDSSGECHQPFIVARQGGATR